MKIHQIKIDFNVTPQIKRFVCDDLRMPFLKMNPLFKRSVLSHLEE